MGVKFITFLTIGIICFSVIIIGIFFFWTLSEIYNLQETTLSGLELITSLRKIQGYTNKLLITDNLEITYLYWEQAAREFEMAFNSFIKSPRLNVLLQDESIMHKYKAFIILSDRAHNSIEIIEEDYNRLKSIPGLGNQGLFLQSVTDEINTYRSIAEDLREIADYFSSSFENTITPLVISLQNRSRTVQYQIIIGFVIFTVIVFFITLIFSFILKRQEDKRKQEIIKLEGQMNKLESIGVLAGGIAHDFNNILTAIIGNISMAKSWINPHVETFEVLEDAEKASKQALTLTRQLLTFSKGGAPIKELTAVTGLIKETAQFFLRGSNVKCKFDFPGNLWNVEIDKGKICEVINNILINSMQAMPEGGNVKIWAENIRIDKRKSKPYAPGNYVHIAIQDNGSGIPLNIQKKVFDPFFTTKNVGSGLGLSVSYSIIQKHGGYLDFESEVGKGTTFHIYLKASKKTIKDRAKIPLAEFKGQGHILVMDDEAYIRKTCSKMLKHLGYKVATAKDGQEAVSLYKKAIENGTPFQAVILDITVPGGMGGKEAIKGILKLDSAARVIVSSGYSTDTVMAEYKKYGFQGVLKKGYNLNDLGKILYKVINKKN